MITGGQALKTYNVTSSVTATHKLWIDSAEALEANATQAAAKLMGAQMAQKLINDSAFLERELRANTR